MEKMEYNYETDTSVTSKGIHYTAAYERDGKLYGWDGEKEVLMIDMNLNKGDYVSYADELFDMGGLNILDKDTVTVFGVKRRYLELDINKTYWIEGIGATNNMVLYTSVSSHDGMISYIQKCYDNDKLIFSIDEFKPQGKPVGITSTTADVCNDGKTYNINGTIANGKEKNKILIRNGKKFINRF